MGHFHSLATTVNIFADTFRYLELSRDPEASIPQLKKQWARDVLARLGLDVESHGEVSSRKPVLLVGNHVSYLDIPLLMSVAPEISFVAKEEIRYWPLFGHGATKIGTVYVKREKRDSRAQARAAIREGLAAGRRIVLFPSGTTCIGGEKPWRRGAFEIAHETGAWVQPFRLTYAPLRLAAYIDDDFFPTHLMNLSRGTGLRARIEFHEPIQVRDPAFECERWRSWSQWGGRMKTKLKCDLHIHSSFSDGSLSVTELVDLFGGQGFDAIAVTDHLCERRSLIGRVSHHLRYSLSEDGFAAYMKTLRKEARRAMDRYGMLLIPGYEITKNSFVNHRSAHLLVLGTERFISPDLPIDEILRQAREEGAFTVAAHPFHTGEFEFQTFHLWSRREELADRIGAWEVNCRKKIYPEVLNSGLPLIASSDFHHKGHMSSWRTKIHGKKSTDGIFSALRRKEIDFYYSPDVGEVV